MFLKLRSTIVRNTSSTLDRDEPEMALSDHIPGAADLAECMIAAKFKEILTAMYSAVPAGLPVN
jgi:hypothetical protein